MGELTIKGYNILFIFIAFNKIIKGMGMGLGLGLEHGINALYIDLMFS